MNLVWTTNPPTESGFYWLRIKSNPSYWQSIHWVSAAEIESGVMYFSGCRFEVYEFAGTIPQPVEPTPIQPHKE